MICINIQLFSGRGSAGGMSTGGSGGSITTEETSGKTKRQFTLRNLTSEEKQAFTAAANEAKKQARIDRFNHADYSRAGDVKITQDFGETEAIEDEKERKTYNSITAANRKNVVALEKTVSNLMSTYKYSEKN